MNRHRTPQDPTPGQGWSPGGPGPRERLSGRRSGSPSRPAHAGPLTTDARSSDRGDGHPPHDQESCKRMDNAATTPAAPLSRRERQVLAHMADGLTYDEIAQHMTLSRHTVDTYIRRIRAKTGARNRMQLLMCALPLMADSLDTASELALQD
ncbi:response regulator transcription factor [Streptomyces sp. NPDC087856]|uniref:helix-turn-helix transcriptional regulator n=1 Tax=Streptomyces sp. NPDC087856 TaxID=3365811 RepID=UPI0037F70B0A